MTYRSIELKPFHVCVCVGVPLNGVRMWCRVYVYLQHVSSTPKKQSTFTVVDTYL